MSKKSSIQDVKQDPVDMLVKMYEKVKGTVLLLEEIQPGGKPVFDKTLEERKEFAFKTLIATILSVRTKDETTLRVIEELWAIHNSPKSIADAPVEELEEIIYSTGTYKQKAIRIKETSRIIHEKYNDDVPKDIDVLLELPGVGRKVANCVRSISFGIKCIAVDTHVHRISNRTGWVKTKNPDKTEKALESVFPIDYWTMINYTLVSYGKNICKPNNPLCSDCVVEAQCPKIIIKKPKMGKKKTKAKNKAKKT